MRRTKITDAAIVTSGLSTRFTKGLPHDELGNAHGDDYARMRTAINADPASNPTPDTEFKFDVPLGPTDATNAHPGSAFGSTAPLNFTTDLHGESGNKPKVRGWESPRAGQTYEIEGADMDAVVMAPAPALDPENVDELTAEMAEVYALALLRDVGFSRIADGDTANLGLGYSVGNVIDAVLGLPYFNSDPNEDTAAARRLKGRLNSIGTITSQEIFRGSSPDAKAGPYVSQFLLMGTDPDGPRVQEGRIE